MTSMIAANHSSREEIFPELTRDAIDRMKGAENPREILQLVVSRVHAIVREAKITHDEWWQAIDFLTRSGKMCSDNRQEFILLSDILGISMLVDVIDHIATPGSHACHASAPRQGQVPGKRCSLRSEAISHRPLQVDGGHQHRGI